MATVIRPATSADAASIVQLIRELAVYEKLEHQAQATEAGIRHTLFGPRPRAYVLMAEHDGQLAGFCLYFFNYSTFLAKTGLYIEDIFVREAFRGAGIGKKLFTEAARIAAQEDCGRMEWSVLDWNQPAIDFYLRLGAQAMNEWTVYRLHRDALHALATPSQPQAAHA